MPIPLHDAVAEASDLAIAKAQQTRSLPRYMINSAFAGAYVGVAVVLLLSVSGPLAAAGSPFAKLIGAAVFGVALTLVVFAGAELFTGNNMFMLQGLYFGKVGAANVTAVWVASLFGNLVGSVSFAALVHGAGTLALGAGGGERGPGESLLADVIDSKLAATGAQLFWRAVLCNMLVCLALWMAGRTKNDVAKLGVLWWGLLAFIASGFEHSVANMTIFALGAFEGSAGWGDLVRNLLWTVPGNIVGGGLLVGLAYAYIARAPRPAAVVLSAAAAEQPPLAAAGHSDGRSAVPVVETAGSSQADARK